MKICIELLKTLRANPDNKSRAGQGVSGMAIIANQAALMLAGGALFNAIKSGELADMFTGIVKLAYCALEGLAMNDSELPAQRPEFPSDYVMITIMRQLSQKIASCSSGKSEDYSALIHYCAHLATDFINADFDKAMIVYHTWRMKNTSGIPEHPKSCVADLTDCLFE